MSPRKWKFVVNPSKDGRLQINSAYCSGDLIALHVESKLREVLENMDRDARKGQRQSKGPIPSRRKGLRRTTMIVEIENGKKVRFVNGGRGLERAAYDYNSGDPGSLDNPNHMHVYLSFTFKEFACCGEPLSVEELREAEEAAAGLNEEQEAWAQKNPEAAAIRKGPNGDVMPQDLCEFVELPHGSHYHMGRAVLNQRGIHFTPAEEARR